MERTKTVSSRNSIIYRNLLILQTGHCGQDFHFHHLHALLGCQTFIHINIGKAAVVGTEDKKPVLSDLRESGAIEQDADIVAALHAPDVEIPVTDENIPAAIQLIILKHRNGPTATLDMLFKKKTSTFLSLKKDGGPNDK